MEMNLDERQISVRGKIFKHTVFIFMGLLLLDGILHFASGITFFEGAWSKLAILLIAVIAMSSEMVLRDAFPLTEKARIVLHSFLGIAGFVALIDGIVELAVNNRSFTADKALSETAALIMMGLLFIAGALIYFVKLIKNKVNRGV